MMIILLVVSQTSLVTLRMQEQVCFGWAVLHDGKENKLGSSFQEASSVAGINTGVVLEPYCTWKCDPKTISGVVDFPGVPECPLLLEMSSR